MKDQGPIRQPSPSPRPRVPASPRLPVPPSPRLPLTQRLRRIPTPVWLMAAVLLAAGASALLKGTLPDVVTPVRARIAAWTAPRQPQDTIWEVIDAAKAGQVDRYLGLFGHPVRGQLEQSRREMGEAAFRDYLVRTATEPKGIAISPLEGAESPPSPTPKFRVEFVFSDRNEVQQYTLQRAGRRWQIAAVEGAERIKTLIPYGTPVEKVFGRQ